MSVPTPHYLLFSEPDRRCDSGRWRFVLRSVDGSEELEAGDIEPKARGERLDLLTVVRGLEALDQPSRVTLVGCSPYIRQGMQYGLSEWRSNGWRWECFGQMVPVKNGDLWQRMDRAMEFHRVECRRRRFDSPHDPGIRTASHRRLRYQGSPLLAKCGRWIVALAWSWHRRRNRSWTAPAVCARAG